VLADQTGGQHRRLGLLCQEHLRGDFDAYWKSISNKNTNAPTPAATSINAT
jgi:hypothetical protein